MKKVFFIFLIGILFSVVSFSPVMAQTEKVNLKGRITAVYESDRTISIETEEYDEFIVHFPPEYEFNFTKEDKDTFIHLKGKFQDDGTILAEWGKFEDENGDEGNKEESAYCSGEKEKSHPAALFLAHAFDIELTEIMDQFCAGFGFGQISLALQTEKITGVDYESHLGSREEGVGWGEIWHELGYKGKPKESYKTPPGHEKHPDKDKGEDKDTDEEPDDGVEFKGQEKSQDKKPKKVKKPKKDK